MSEEINRRLGEDNITFTITTDAKGMMVQCDDTPFTVSEVIAAQLLATVARYLCNERYDPAELLWIALQETVAREAEGKAAVFIPPKEKMN